MSVNLFESKYFRSPAMKNSRPVLPLIARLITAGIFCCVISIGFFYNKPVLGSGRTDIDLAVPTPNPAARRVPRPVKYSQFPHDTKAHRVSCNNCHKFPSDNWQKVRSAKDAFPDITEYPKHESCLNCHKQQFFKGAKPAICGICHVNPSPRDSTRHPFPNPREIFDTTAKGRAAVSDFAINFPHDKHIDIVARGGEGKESFVNASWAISRRSAEESCSVCHQTYRPQDKSDDEYLTKPPANLGDGFWLKKGTFKTVPIGHTTCFTCHSADSGMVPAPTDCATCHKIKPPELPVDFDAKIAAAVGLDDKIINTLWRRRDSASKFRHEWFSHAELSCATCHNVSAMNTTSAATMRVKIESCAACHVTATSADGGALNYEIDMRRSNATFQCVKCHLSLGSGPIPESHVKAIAAAK